MKKIIFFAICLLCLTTVKSQVTVYAKSFNNEVHPVLVISGAKKINDKFNFTYFSLVNEKWAQGYLGVSYSPSKYVTFGISGGMEQKKSLYRIASFIWLGKDKTSFVLAAEKGDGRDNYWYRTTLAYNVSNHINVGVRAWRFHGVGPVVDYKINKLQSKLWVMPAYDFEAETAKFMVGLDIKI